MARADSLAVHPVIVAVQQAMLPNLRSAFHAQPGLTEDPLPTSHFSLRPLAPFSEGTRAIIMRAIPFSLAPPAAQSALSEMLTMAVFAATNLPRNYKRKAWDRENRCRCSGNLSTPIQQLRE